MLVLRPELDERWELRIAVATAFEETMVRAVRRDGGTSSAADVERRWRERYPPSQHPVVQKRADGASDRGAPPDVRAR